MNIQQLQTKETKEALKIYYINNYDIFILLAMKSVNGKMLYYHPDHLGSTTLITNSSGNKTENTFYLPFGDVLSGGNERFGYTGKELDTETNLNYYGARYYDSYFMHFTQADSLLPDAYDPQQLNRYAYVKNNPYKYVDEEGEVVVEAVRLLFAAAIPIIRSTLIKIGLFFIDVFEEDRSRDGNLEIEIEEKDFTPEIDVDLDKKDKGDSSGSSQLPPTIDYISGLNIVETSSRDDNLFWYLAFSDENQIPKGNIQKDTESSKNGNDQDKSSMGSLPQNEEKRSFTSKVRDFFGMGERVNKKTLK